MNAYRTHTCAALRASDAGAASPRTDDARVLGKVKVVRYKSMVGS